MTNTGHNTIIMEDMQTAIMMTPTTAMMATSGLTPPIVTIWPHIRRFQDHIHQPFSLQRQLCLWWTVQQSKQTVMESPMASHSTRDSMMLWLARATVITIPSVQGSIRDRARVMSYRSFLETPVLTTPLVTRYQIHQLLAKQRHLFPWWSVPVA
jgi:hypothetical protein